MLNEEFPRFLFLAYTNCLANVWEPLCKFYLLARAKAKASLWKSFKILLCDERQSGRELTTKKKSENVSSNNE
jgi:hypothetical protein